MASIAQVAERDDVQVWRAFSDATDGDVGVDVDEDVLAGRRARLAPGEWTWLRQVHGADVVRVEAPGAGAATPADACVTAATGAVMSVVTADCAGVVLWSVDGERPVVGAAHAGWQGLRAGILQACVAELRTLGARTIEWELGPCISPAAYEFSEADLSELCDQLGPSLRSVTASGAPALDLRAGVRAALADAGVAVDRLDPTEVPCTALDGERFSWRARQDTARQTAAIWMATP